MTEKNPPSRPALRKSVDATVHPALAGRAAGLTGKGAAAGPLPPAPTQTAAGKPARTASGKPARSASGKPLAKAKRAPTSDAVRPTKSDPAVKVSLAMPKSLRKKLRAQAKQWGIEPEELAVRLIAESLD